MTYRQYAFLTSKNRLHKLKRKIIRSDGVRLSCALMLVNMMLSMPDNLHLPSGTSPVWLSCSVPARKHMWLSMRPVYVEQNYYIVNIISHTFRMTTRTQPQCILGKLNIHNYLPIVW